MEWHLARKTKSVMRPAHSSIFYAIELALFCRHGLDFRREAARPWSIKL
jgi:hypothetical protein